MNKITERQFDEMRNQMIIDFLKAAGPKERHRLVMDWNWDNDYDVLKWIANDPNTDKATALMLYWKNVPRPMKKYMDRDEYIKEKGKMFINQYDFCEELEKLYLSGFYGHQQFAYDPQNDYGTDWTSEFLDIAVKREIPKEMFVKLHGEDVPYPEDLEEGIPPVLCKEMSLLEKMIED